MVADYRVAPPSRQRRRRRHDRHAVLSNAVASAIADSTADLPTNVCADTFPLPHDAFCIPILGSL